MLFGDKYAPQSLGDVDFAKDTAERLGHMGKNLMNSIFYGPRSSGKRTRVLALLKDIYGKSKVNNKKIFEVDSSSKSKLTIIYYQSQVHIEIDFSRCAMNDRYIISDLIKPTACCKNIRTQQPQIFVITAADKICELAQKMLLSIIEKSQATARFIFITTHLNKLIEPLISRCMTVRCRGPNKKEITDILFNIAANEKLSLTKEMANDLASTTLKQAIHNLQLSFMYGSYQPSINRSSEHLVNLTTAIETNDIMCVREAIYTLTVKNIDYVDLFKYLITYFISKTTETGKIVHFAAFYQSQMSKGNKQPFYIEAFIARCVNL